jgi:hypothetical protein
MDPKNTVVLHATIARRFPAPQDAPLELATVETHVFRVKAAEVPPGIPDDANPREPNLNRQVYRRVRRSLEGEEGPASFHLKHGGIVLVAERVEKLPGDRYRLAFNPDVKQGVTNGNHSYKLILESQEAGNIPDNQYVEIKVHVGVQPDLVPELADGLNSSMQVREESLADLRNQFDWLKKGPLAAHPKGLDAISWHEGNDGEYDIREVLALLMALDPSRYPLENPIGVENTYARLSSVFKAYLAKPDEVERFRDISVEALELYEYIRITAIALWNTDGRRFRGTVLADRKKSGMFEFPFLLDEKKRPLKADARLTKAAAVPCFSAFRALVTVSTDGGQAVWRYPFSQIKEMWDEYGGEILREVYDAVTKQHNNNTHYAGRSVMLYRATAKTLELADLRRRVAS